MHYMKYTGIHISQGAKPRLIDNDQGLVFVDYDDLSHKLWRAQEFTLFARNKKFLHKPILDLGCGDGSFASALFDNIDYGVDPDTVAVNVANSLGIYSYIINSLAEETGLPNESIGSVYSNSVLEHTTNLNAIIAEVNRILKPNGTFIFTVPNAEFTRIMSAVLW